MAWENTIKKNERKAKMLVKYAKEELNIKPEELQKVFNEALMDIKFYQYLEKNPRKPFGTKVNKP